MVWWGPGVKPLVSGLVGGQSPPEAFYQRLLSVPRLLDSVRTLSPNNCCLRVSQLIELVILLRPPSLQFTTRLSKPSINAGEVGLCALVLLDLSAAFDTMDHQTLLRVLRCRIGVTDAALSWCSSYLRQRTQIFNTNE